MAEGESPPQVNKPQESKGKYLVPLAATAGAIAGLVPSGIEAVRAKKEIDKPADPRIRIETGLHITVPLEDSPEYKDFQNGNPDAHAWLHDDDLVDRLAADPPQVLAVDGFSPVPLGGELDTDFMWVALPARPRRINPLGFYTVSGDNQFIDIGEEISALENNNSSSEEDAYARVAAQENEADNSVILRDIRGREKSGLTELRNGALVVAGSAAPGLARRLTRRLTHRFETKGRHHGSNTGEPDEGTTDTGGMKRRTLLKAGGAIAVASVAASAAGMLTKGIADSVASTAQDIGQYQAAGAPTESLKDFWQTVNNYIAEIPEEVSTDGRTAMLIAKQEDAMDYLQDKDHPYLKPDAQGAIVLGASHDYKAERFIKDKDSRDEAMREYARHIVQIVDKLSYNTYHLSNKKRSLLTRELLQYLSKVDICHVSDPGIPPDTNLSYYAQQNIKPINQIESKQVMGAIGRLTFDQALAKTDS